MPLCKDNAISQLNSLGYDVVRLPRADIQPLDVLIERDGQFTRLARLPKLWISEAAAPSLIADLPGSTIKSVTTSQLKGGFGIQALVDAIGKVGFQASGSKNTSMQLTAEDVVVTQCQFDELASFVGSGEIDPASASGHFFLDDGNRVWIITEIIASNKLKIVVGDRSQGEAEAKASEITNSLKVSADVASATSSGNTITYNRKAPLVFGFKSAEIRYEGGWRIELPAPAGKKYFGDSNGRGEPREVRVSGRRLDLKALE